MSPDDAKHEHVDVELAADFDEGLLDATAAAAFADRIADCATCSATLEAIRGARAALRNQPPTAMPADVADRLALALQGEARSARVPGGAMTVTALEPRRRRTWLIGASVAAVAASVAVLAMNGQLWRHATNTPAMAVSVAEPAPVVALPTSESAADYGTNTRARLSQVLQADAVAVSFAARENAAPQEDANYSFTAAGNTPLDLASGKVTVGDPYAALRDPGTVRACVARLLGDPSPMPPLLIAFGYFNGTPAAVFVFTSARPRTYDAFIVGMGCGPSGDDALRFVRVDMPG